VHVDVMVSPIVVTSASQGHSSHIAGSGFCSLCCYICRLVVACCHVCCQPVSWLVLIVDELLQDGRFVPSEPLDCRSRQQHAHLLLLAMSPCCAMLQFYFHQSPVLTVLLCLFHCCRHHNRSVSPSALLKLVLCLKYFGSLNCIHAHLQTCLDSAQPWPHDFWLCRHL